MSYSLRILKVAHADAHEMADYIGQRSVAGMNRWFDAYEQIQKQICEHPFTFGLAPENHLFTYELRQAFFKTKNGRTYRTVYFVVEKEVILLRVRGPGQKPLRKRDLRLS